MRLVMKSDSMHQDGPHADADQHTPWLEWIASGTGLMLVLCMAGFIGWHALSDATSPPVIAIETTDVEPVAGGYRVMFLARNAGGAAAAQVRIEGTLAVGSRPPEVSSVILDYIPGQSSREGGLFFMQDPRSGNLTLRASGFAKP
jgi:uncharacterized protein (TIGR02588 family)